MKMLLKYAPETLPGVIRKSLLKRLFRATAAGFQSPAPAVDSSSFDELLRRYAVFTRQLAEAALQSGGDIPQLKRRLYQQAFSLGAMVRKWAGIRSTAEAVEAGRILYRAIEIDLQGDARGNLTIRRCYFSQYYSCQVCGLISALDDGLFAGLSGGGRLSFSQRLTDGSPCCRARLVFPEAGNI